MKSIDERQAIEVARIKRACITGSLIKAFKEIFSAFTQSRAREATHEVFCNFFFAKVIGAVDEFEKLESTLASRVSGDAGNVKQIILLMDQELILNNALIKFETSILSKPRSNLKFQSKPSCKSQIKFIKIVFRPEAQQKKIDDTKVQLN